MSHGASFWAMNQQVSGNTKLVLLVLADRHNRDGGCFPSQARIAADCGLSRAAVNTHLAKLEEMGLIRRLRNTDPVTKRQRPTSYIFAFEPQFATASSEPCLDRGHGSDSRDEQDAAPAFEPASAPETAPSGRGESGNEIGPCQDAGHGTRVQIFRDPCPDFAPTRVQNLDTNLEVNPEDNPARARSSPRRQLRTPARNENASEGDHRGESDVEDWPDLLAAVGLDPDAPPGGWADRSAREHVERWRAKLGLSWSRILRTARNSRHARGEPPESPEALDAAMERAADRLGTRPPPPSPEDVIRAHDRRMADWIKSGRRVPGSAVSNTQAWRLLDAGLVTRADLRAAGIPW